MVDNDTREGHLARLAARMAPPGPCPADDTIVAWVEGRVDTAMSATMEAHLASCAPCRAEADALAEVLDAVPLRTARPWARPLARFAAVLLAASVLVGLGLLLYSPTPASRTPALDLASLQVAARSLAARMPEPWRGFTPLTEDELAGRSTLERGGIDGLRPGGTITATRPLLRWRGAGPARLRVLDEEGRVRLQAATSETTYTWPDEAPPLDAGLGYVLMIEQQRDETVVRGSRAFRVASPAEDEDFEAALRVLDEAGPDALRRLLRAHLALRAQRHETALLEVEAALVAGAGAHGEAVRARARRLLGEPDDSEAP